MSIGYANICSSVQDHRQKLGSGRTKESKGINKKEAYVGTKGVSQLRHLIFDDNKVLKIINWIC